MPPERAPRVNPRLGPLLLTAFGLGTVPRMPGTVASLAVALFIGIAYSDLRSGLMLCLLFIAFGVVVTLRFAGAATDAKGHADPGWVVSDEVAGQGLACLGVLGDGCSWASLLAAFLLFRLFDILKPWPVGALERLPGPIGVLMDDVAAGVIAAVLVLAAGALGAFALV